MNQIKQAVEKQRSLILEAERYIWKNPETGYKEVKTSRYMEEKFRALGYDLVLAGDIPGFYTVVDTGKEGPEVLIFGELDSVICPTHPECDPETGAVHACGHNVQCAALLGIAAALKEEGMLDGLSGRIRLCAVPAEELLEIEYRSSLIKEGKIRHYGGKSEFLRRGYFDGVDLAFMVHAAGRNYIPGGANGCIAKRVVYKGRAAHAGGSPHAGINALYAANLGMSAVNALRETFRDEEYIRVHPIVTAGGSMVNAIPATVVLESYVRGKTYDAILRENRKVNRAFVGGALSLGANVEILDDPGYAPLFNDPHLIELAERAFRLQFPDGEIEVAPLSTDRGSTDMGDLSSVMPALHIYAAGTRGAGHGSDYVIADPEIACLHSAVWQLTLLRLLLSDGAREAKRVIEEHPPLFASKEAYFAYVDAIHTEGDRIIYEEDGTARVR